MPTPTKQLNQTDEAAQQWQWHGKENYAESSESADDEAMPTDGGVTVNGGCRYPLTINCMVFHLLQSSHKQAPNTRLWETII